MDIYQKISEVADAIIKRAADHATNLMRENPGFKVHPEQIKAYNQNLNAAKHELAMIQSRISGFKKKIGTDAQCPNCWFKRGVMGKVEPINIGTRNRDFYRCNTCGSEFEVDFR